MRFVQYVPSSAVEIGHQPRGFEFSNTEELLNNPIVNQFKKGMNGLEFYR